MTSIAYPLLAAPPSVPLLAANVPARIEVDVVTHSDALLFLRTLPSGERLGTVHNL